MKRLVDEIKAGLLPSSIAPGRKLEKEPTGMSVKGRHLGPATLPRTPSSTSARSAKSS